MTAGNNSFNSSIARIPWSLKDCKSAQCGITKTKFIGGLTGDGLLDTALDPVTEIFLQYGVPCMVKKSGEMARHYGSEALRNKKFPDKVGNYVLDKDKKMPKKQLIRE